MHRWVSTALSKHRQPIDRQGEAIACGGPRPLQATRVVELGPVVGVHDPGTFIVERLDLPSPEMADRWLAWLSGLPRNQPALDELDHVVVADGPSGEGRPEDVADCMHPLSGLGGGQIVVAVPLGLTGRFSDQFEDPIRRRTHLA